MSHALHWLWLAVFTLVWLVPVTFHGLARRRLPGAPRLLYQTTNVSCLFVSSAPYVPQQYIQVLRPGETEWVTEEDGHYLRMSPFGYRTRLDEMLRKGLDSRQGMTELADYVARRYAVRTRVAPAAVRFVTGVVLPVPAPEGHFRKPPLAEIPRPRREVWFTRVYQPLPPEVLRKPA
jgi:hypothetical protein